jgi:hypothetical protein
MKENTETIHNSIFTHCQSSHIRENQFFLLFNSLKKCVLACKDQIQNGAAVLGIGIVFLATAYLFLMQLAEYGWQ